MEENEVPPPAPNAPILEDRKDLTDLVKKNMRQAKRLISEYADSTSMLLKKKPRLDARDCRIRPCHATLLKNENMVRLIRFSSKPPAPMPNQPPIPNMM